MTAKKTTKGLLGVLVSNNAWKGLADNTPHYRLKLLAEANKEEKLNLFFFSINTVNLRKKEIKGCYFDFKDNAWKTDKFPYPDLLFRRGGASKNFQKQYLTFINQCKKMEVVLINPSSLGNWEVYNYFSSVKSLEKYLLETMLYTDPEDLFYMIKKHQTIYLKGVIGRKGKNVLRVEHLPSNEFQCTHYNYRKRKVIVRCMEM